MKRRYGVVLKEYLKHAIDVWLPERQLILRTDGRIRYLKFSQNFQIMLSVVAFGAVAWGAFTSVTYFLFDDILRSKDAQITTAHDNYRNLLNEVSQYQARFSLLTKELQQNHAMMLDLVENNATLQLNLRSAQKNLETSRIQQSEINAAKNALRVKLASIEVELDSLNGRNFELRGNLASVTSDLQAVLNERDEAHAVNKTLKTQVAQLENEVSQLHLTETEVVTRLAERTQEGIQFMERVFARAGLDADEFLAQLAVDAKEEPVGSREDESESEAADEVADQAQDEELAVEIADVAETEPEQTAPVPSIEMAIVRRAVGQGGPFIAARPQRPESGEKLKASLSDLEERLGRWDDLRQLMRSAPLPAPLDEFQLSSSFGKRRDPIRGRLSMHYGLDLRAPMGSPVYTTAPGIVTIASAQNEYGRLVEIDHGMGFKTRYAHLKKILVKAGQKVEYRDKIGLLGNSGRSTGPHLHYEIAHNGRPVDPMRFLKAGKYVYKGQ